MDEALDDATHAEIKRRCALGDGHVERAEYPQALTQYWATWDLLPEPKTQWNAATWILGAIGDANFASGDYAAGRDNLSNAMFCPGAVGNPFLHLRLGQCQFELGNLDRAADELMRAYTWALERTSLRKRTGSTLYFSRPARRISRRRENQRNHGNFGNDF